ncbi:MAG: hypothetical protein R2695_12860 [Acidimicrobiales bacterium]
MQLFPRGLNGGWVEVDTTPPFRFVLDASALPVGRTDMPVLGASDGTTARLRGRARRGRRVQRPPSCAAVRTPTFATSTTHNAMSSSADGWAGPNQHLDVPAQLALGVRGLMLDTARAGDLNDLGQVQLPGVDPRHGAAVPRPVPARSSGPRRRPAEIRAFLDAEPGGRDADHRVVPRPRPHRRRLRPLPEAPPPYTHPGGPWPTLGEMIDRRQPAGGAAGRGRRPGVSLADERLDALVRDPVLGVDSWRLHVRPPAGSPANQLFILNHFLTNVFGSPTLADQVNHNPLLLDRARQCEAVHDRSANFVTVDFVDIGDGLSAVDTLNSF